MPSVHIQIPEQPVKLTGEATMSSSELEQQARTAQQVLTAVPPTALSTCGDERERVGLLSGEPAVEVRKSVWGGSVVYGLYVAELANLYGDNKELTGHDRLAKTVEVLTDAGIALGGHLGCAANGQLEAIMGILGDGVDEWARVALGELGTAYDQTAVYSIAHNLKTVNTQKRYKGWQEQHLIDSLGDKAGSVIEILKPGAPHDARSIIRIDVAGKTVGQNDLSHATGGEHSFIQTEWHCQEIEDALAATSVDRQVGRVMLHAREALLWAVEQAVPNPELHQISLSSV